MITTLRRVPRDARILVFGCATALTLATGFGLHKLRGPDIRRRSVDHAARAARVARAGVAVH
ncbi:hypothetical protein GQ42DRAFT_163670 [Ramicandelaber brevisporus]|nr:hypothetical protein GQ42DRAFT_163670 [Ramicandelaber brevisporus]